MRGWRRHSGQISGHRRKTLRRGTRCHLLLLRGGLFIRSWQNWQRAFDFLKRRNICLCFLQLFVNVIDLVLFWFDSLLEKFQKLFFLLLDDTESKEKKKKKRMWLFWQLGSSLRFTSISFGTLRTAFEPCQFCHKNSSSCLPGSPKSPSVTSTNSLSPSKNRAQPPILRYFVVPRKENRPKMLSAKSRN